MHLDTNMLIGAMDVSSPSRSRVLQWLRAGEPLSVCALAWSEFLCGPVSPSDEARCLGILEHIEPVDAATAALASRFFNATGRRSCSLADCIIAAAAVLANQPLATENARAFEPFIPFGLNVDRPE